MKHVRSNSAPARAHERAASPGGVRRRVRGFTPAVAAALVALAAACGGRTGGEGPGEAGSPRYGAPGSASVEWAGLRFRYVLPVSRPDRIRIRAEVTNVSGRVREAEIPLCVVQARLYRDGAVAYDQAEADGCGEAIRVVRLRDGESREFRRTLSAGEVLGDSLRPGPFEVRVRLPRNAGRGPPRAEMDFVLGTVELRRDRGGEGGRPPTGRRF